MGLWQFRIFNTFMFSTASMILFELHGATLKPNPAGIQGSHSYGWNKNPPTPLFQGSMKFFPFSGEDSTAFPTSTRPRTAEPAPSVNGDAAVFAAPARAGVATRTAVTKGSEEMLSMESVRSISVRVLQEVGKLFGGSWEYLGIATG